MYASLDRTPQSSDRGRSPENPGPLPRLRGAISRCNYARIFSILCTGTVHGYIHKTDRWTWQTLTGMCET